MMDVFLLLVDLMPLLQMYLAKSISIIPITKVAQKRVPYCNLGILILWPIHQTTFMLWEAVQSMEFWMHAKGIRLI